MVSCRLALIRLQLNLDWKKYKCINSTLTQKCHKCVECKQCITVLSVFIIQVAKPFLMLLVDLLN